MDEHKKSLIVTEPALVKLKEILDEEKNKNLKLRLFVAGSGCAGIQYGFTFDETVYPDDTTIERKIISEEKESFIKLVIDPISFQYLSTATIDFNHEHGEGHFSIKNPNVRTTCACGSIRPED